MYEDLREKAIKSLEKKRKKRKEVQTVAVTFATAAVILLLVSSQLSGPAVFWVRMPIIILALVYGMVHVSEYGFSLSGSDDHLTEEEIERELVNIYRKSNLDKVASVSDNVDLELRQLEALKEQYEERDDLV